ncbi:hypothetical protein [Heliorestis convoluta]|uniref:hypothetical protein n=1 Tax=Heliorestis convoluta TaxID=356322 RepID=UPI00129BB584|nr:hypothetical protein [Heliorestis convoluta]
MNWHDMTVNEAVGQWASDMIARGLPDQVFNRVWTIILPKDSVPFRDAFGIVLPFRWGYVVVIAGQSRGFNPYLPEIFAHEVGHIYDFRLMEHESRQQWMNSNGFEGQSVDEWTVGGIDSPSEIFADWVMERYGSDIVKGD